jgi:hypothetical protein
MGEKKSRRLQAGGGLVEELANRFGRKNQRRARLTRRALLAGMGSALGGHRFQTSVVWGLRFAFDEAH